MIRFLTDDNISFEYFNPNSDYHLTLLEKYFEHPKTPYNNSSHKRFKTHLYSDFNTGMCIFGICNNEIVCVTTAFVLEYGNIPVVKKSHRLNIRRDFTQLFFTIMCKHFEPMFYEWLSRVKVYTLISTVNEGLEKNLTGTTRFHFLRSNSYHYLNDIGKKFLLNDWVIYPYMIREQHCWQYFYWSSLDGIEWNKEWRDTKPISDSFTQELNKKFTTKREDGAWTFTLKK